MFGLTMFPSSSCILRLRLAFGPRWRTQHWRVVLLFVMVACGVPWNHLCHNPRFLRFKFLLPQFGCDFLNFVDLLIDVAQPTRHFAGRWMDGRLLLRGLLFQTCGLKFPDERGLAVVVCAHNKWLPGRAKQSGDGTARLDGFKELFLLLSESRCVRHRAGTSLRL